MMFLRAAVWLGVVAAILAGCKWMPGRPTEADGPVIPSQVKDFAALYSEYCAGCHGADGRFGAALPLNDPVYLALASDDVLRQVTVQGVPGTTMAAFGHDAGGYLTDKQVDILVRGMRARWARPDQFRNVALPLYSSRAAEASGESPGNPQRGKAVYATYCARCHGPDGHGPDGRGGTKAGPITDPSYLVLVSDQALRTTVIVGRPDLGMPDWRNRVAGTPMSPQEISDVVAWLAAQRQPLAARPSAASARAGTS
jgi:cytochrome c oxidase cbb3-type subunit 3